MARTYNARLINYSKKGYQVVVTFNGKSVTRHLNKAKQGKHPDDTMPAKHAKAETRIVDLRRLRVATLVSIAITEALLENPSTDAKEKSIQAKKLTPWRAFVLRAPADIRNLEHQLLKLQQEDPLLVRYTIEGMPA